MLWFVQRHVTTQEPADCTFCDLNKGGSLVVSKLLLACRVVGLPGPARWSDQDGCWRCSLGTHIGTWWRRPARGEGGGRGNRLAR